MPNRLVYLFEAFITTVLFVPVLAVAAFLTSYNLLLAGLGSSIVNFIAPLIAFSLLGLMLWDKRGLLLFLPLALAICLFSLSHGQWATAGITALLASYAGRTLGQRMKRQFISFKLGNEKASPPELITHIIVMTICIGAIGTFMIPKCLGCTGTNSRTTAVSKEAASMISSAFCSYTDEHKLTKDTQPSDLLPLMNYVAIDTSGNYRNEDMPFEPNWLDKLWSKVAKKGQQGTPLQPCSLKLPCLKLYNGGILQYDSEQKLGGTGSSNAIFFNLDPDGKGFQGRVSFYQYADKKLTTGETKIKETAISSGSLVSQNEDPAYLKEWLR